MPYEFIALPNDVRWIFKMSCKYLIVLDILSGVWKYVISVPGLFFDVFDYRALLDLLIYGPDPWRNPLKHYIQNRKNLGSNPNLVNKLLVTLGSSIVQIVV